MRVDEVIKTEDSIGSIYIDSNIVYQYFINEADIYWKKETSRLSEIIAFILVGLSLLCWYTVQARSQPQNSKGAPVTSEGAHNWPPQEWLQNLHPSP